MGLAVAMAAGAAVPDAAHPHDPATPAHRSAFVIAATRSFEPDPQRETDLIACVNGT